MSVGDGPAPPLQRDGFTLREVVIHGGGKKDLTGDGNGEVMNPRSSQQQKTYVPLSN